MGEEGWVHLIKSEFDILVFIITFKNNLNRGHLRSIAKVTSRPQLLLGFFLLFFLGLIMN